MGLDKLIQSIATIAVLVVASGHLPQTLKAVRQAQLQLIQDSKASKWGQAFLLPPSK
ncbi:MAG: hypothetical protein IPK04_23175 [Bdellovibrionales bacterium]|nr:hypothetical protein [Bdellovibrionales bacterium]